MASVRRDAALRQIDRLFGEGTLAGLPDARLLERYVAHRDELAFEALVRRHGPMVMGVCRRVLRRPQRRRRRLPGRLPPAARKARSIWIDGSLGGWLHRVAWRIAIQVRSDAARRRDQERSAAERAGEPITLGPAHDDTRRGDPPGDRPAARSLPPAGRALLPRGHDLPAGRRSTAVERGDDAGPAGQGAGPAPRPADPPRGDPGRGGTEHRGGASAEPGRGGPGRAAPGDRPRRAADRPG